LVDCLGWSVECSVGWSAERGQSFLFSPLKRLFFKGEKVINIQPAN